MSLSYTNSNATLSVMKKRTLVIELPAYADHEALRSFLGGRIRRAREKAGLSQRELSTVAEISTQQIASIEQGRRLPSLPTLVKLASALRRI